ncbi:MAG TPA: outer membrane beta-barrel protein [Candidatus Dormibacteraeota bacterium]|nr:outer membrane beta-barrel protein [Candidatus Dormibacteraeota bacterium]
MRNLAVAFFLCLCLTGMANAQIPTSGNVFVGYSFENTNWSGLNSTLSRPNLHGWEASLEGKVFPHIGIVTDFSGHYGSQHFTEFTPNGPVVVNVTGHEWEALFGPRLSVPVGKVTPFGEVMVGIAHINNGGISNSNTSFATAIGGGLDYRLVRLIALRLEGDYLRTRFFSTTQNDLRLSTGIVIRF